MADDTERLIVLFETRLKDFERSMGKSVRTTRSTRVQIEREADQLTKNVQSRFAKVGDGMGSQRIMSMARTALGVAGIGLGANAISNLTSEWSDLNSRVNNAVGSMSRGTEVMGRLGEMARRTYSSIGQTTESFIQNADALTELGYNYTQQLDMTEALNNALVISATRGQQADSVMRAWTNAMALGELRGDNLNSVIQGSTRLTRALADSMGVSTNELRSLGAAGQITARDMVGITKELETLRAEADAMPATLQDSFVLLGNAVMQFVGQVDQASGATGFLAGEIIQLADDIEDAANRWADGTVPIQQWAQAVGDLSRELGILSDAVEDTRSDVEIVDDAAVDARFAFADLAAEIANLENARAFAPDMVTEIESVTNKLLLNEMSAEDARAALLALGQANPDFGGLIGQLARLAGELRIVTAEADAMHAAINNPGGPTGGGTGRGGTGAARRAAIERDLALGSYTTERERVLGLTREQLSLETAIAREIKNAADAGVALGQAEAERLARLQLTQSASNRSSGGGGGGGGGSNAYADAAKSMRERIESMRQETAMLASLNPAINDYGFALAKARGQLELENAAAKEGIALTPERVAQIELLANGYATATAEAERLATAQGLATQAAEELGQAGRNALDSIIDGFLDGKDAGEIFNSMLRDLGRNLIRIGIDQVSGGFQAGGFNPLGFLTGMLGFASGTANIGGARGQVRGLVHGQEAVIPLPSGGRVPVDIRTPVVPNFAPSAPQELRLHIVSDDEKFSAYVTDKAGQVVARSAPTIMGASVGQANRSAPAALAMHQRQRAGSDYRL